MINDILNTVVSFRAELMLVEVVSRRGHFRGLHLGEFFDRRVNVLREGEDDQYVEAALCHHDRQIADKNHTNAVRIIRVLNQLDRHDKGANDGGARYNDGEEDEPDEAWSYVVGF